MKRAWEFAKPFLLSPSRAAEACERKGAIDDGLKVYAVFAAVELLSARFDPLSFLDPNSPVTPPHGAAFWFHVALWEPVVFALSVFFTILVLDWMREGWLPLKTAAATLWSALPLALAINYAHSGYRPAFGRGSYLLMSAAWAAPAVFLARRIPEARWRKLTAFLLGLNAVQLATLVLEYALVVPLRSKSVFIALSVGTLLWLLAVVAVGMRRLEQMSAARAVLAFTFAILVSSVVPVLAYLLGLMPMEVLKVVLYV